MVPQLARTVGPKFNKFPCYIQPKLNGIRLLYGSGVAQSRDEKCWHPSILRHITDELQSVPELSRFILDGELYVHGWRLQRINGAVAVNRRDLRFDTTDVQYHIFDAVDPANPTAPFSERFLPLYAFLQRRSWVHIRLVTTVAVSDRVMFDAHFHHFVGLGYEGIMARPDGPYILGRTEHDTEQRSQYLWKHKSWKDDEFSVIGIIRGEGKADIGAGALTCCTASGRSFNVGTGYTDEERIEFFTSPPTRIKVRYLELSADGVPLNTSFLCVMQ